MAAGAHRVLTIEVWHQTSGSKGTNNLRDVLLVPAGIDMEACHRKCVTLLRKSVFLGVIVSFGDVNDRTGSRSKLVGREAGVLIRSGHRGNLL